MRSRQLKRHDFLSRTGHGKPEIEAKWHSQSLEARVRSGIHKEKSDTVKVQVLESRRDREAQSGRAPALQSIKS